MEETPQPNSNEGSKESQLIISKVAISFLSETSKWTKFLSIVGFVFVGLIVFVGLFAGSLMSFMSNGNSMPKGMGFFLGFIYVAMGLLYFFPTLYLFNFSRKMKAAISTHDEEELNAALSDQKSFYKFWGVFMIVILGLYAVMGLFALVIASLKR